MKEIRQLRGQITNIINQLNPSANLIMDPKMKPPTPIQEKLLRQIILAGFIDNVAMLKKKNHVPNSYTSQNVAGDEGIFIHPSSSLHLETPDYVVYCELFRSSRLFIKYVTVIEGEWIGRLGNSMCSLGKPLENPAPRYNKKRDQVTCYYSPLYGTAQWELPAIEMEFAPGNECAKYYASFFLEGIIFPALKPFAQYLTAKSSIILKTWTQPKIQLLVGPLARFSINSRKKLEEIWKQKGKVFFRTPR